MSKVKKISDLQFFKNHCADKASDGRAVSECKYCKKHKHPPKMSSRYICRDCSNSTQKKHQAKLRADLRAEREARVDAQTYPLSQPWVNLANVVGA